MAAWSSQQQLSPALLVRSTAQTHDRFVPLSSLPDAFDAGVRRQQGPDDDAVGRDAEQAAVAAAWLDVAGAVRASRAAEAATAAREARSERAAAELRLAASSAGPEDCEAEEDAAAAVLQAALDSFLDEYPVHRAGRGDALSSRGGSNASAGSGPAAAPTAAWEPPPMRNAFDFMPRQYDLLQAEEEASWRRARDADPDAAWLLRAPAPFRGNGHTWFLRPEHAHPFEEPSVKKLLLRLGFMDSAPLRRLRGGAPEPEREREVEAAHRQRGDGPRGQLIAQR